MATRELERFQRQAQPAAYYSSAGALKIPKSKLFCFPKGFSFVQLFAFCFPKRRLSLENLATLFGIAPILEVAPGTRQELCELCTIL